MRFVEATFQALWDHYGPQHWWPADSPFEVMVGAILTQNTNWTNVERAIANLRAASLLEPRALAAYPLLHLHTLIRPAGYFRQKSLRIQTFATWFVERFAGDVERMRGQPTASLREELLALKGIGRETADSILLYALHHPIFVVDTYTFRVAARHGWVETAIDYDELRETFERELPADEGTMGELHGLLVRVGKEFCRPREPRCTACPLAPLLPPTGPCDLAG